MRREAAFLHFPAQRTSWVLVCHQVASISVHLQNPDTFSYNFLLSSVKLCKCSSLQMIPKQEEWEVEEEVEILNSHRALESRWN